MDNQQKIKEEILNRELRKYVERKTLLEIELAYQKKLDPNEMSGKKPLKVIAGKPVSWQEIKRCDYIAIKEEELESVNSIIETIKEQFQK